MASSQDRRFHRRHEGPAAIRWAFFNSDGYNRAEMVDYGKGGLSFESTISLRPGMNLTIKGENDQFGGLQAGVDEGFPTVKVAEVKWCQQQGDPFKDVRYQVGVRYLPGYYDD